VRAHALIESEQDGATLPTVGPAAIEVRAQLDADFAAWCHLVLPRVLRFVSRMAASRAEAEDLASEALARAYARWATVGQLPNRDGWVMRTAANVSVDAARHASRFPWDRLRNQRTGTVQAVDDEVVDRRTLATALSRLPGRQREAVALRFLGGLTVEETAAAMGLRSETVRTHTSRGLATLRSALGEWTKELDRARD
jgi:RNA polymerase sigma factor (sigma-70 family)